MSRRTRAGRTRPRRSRQRRPGRCRAHIRRPRRALGCPRQRVFRALSEIDGTACRLQRGRWAAATTSWPRPMDAARHRAVPRCARATGGLGWRSGRETTTSTASPRRRRSVLAVATPVERDADIVGSAELDQRLKNARGPRCLMRSASARMYSACCWRVAASAPESTTRACGELAEWLEQAIAHGAIGLLLGLDHGLRDETWEHLERVDALPVRRDLRAFERESSGEYRQSREQLLLWSVEQRVAPVHRGGQRLVARRRAARAGTGEAKRIVEQTRDIVRRSSTSTTPSTIAGGWATLRASRSARRVLQHHQDRQRSPAARIRATWPGRQARMHGRRRRRAARQRRPEHAERIPSATTAAYHSAALAQTGSSRERAHRLLRACAPCVARVHLGRGSASDVLRACAAVSARTHPGRGSLRPPAASRCCARKLAARSFPRRPPAAWSGRHVGYREELSLKRDVLARADASRREARFVWSRGSGRRRGDEEGQSRRCCAAGREVEVRVSAQSVRLVSSGDIPDFTTTQGAVKGAALRRAAACQRS